MKFEDCKVGDIVTPEANKIKTRDFCDVATHLALTNEFIITGLSRYTKTVDIAPINPKADTGYFFVDPSCLNPVNFHEFPISDVLNSEPITCSQTPIEQSVDFKIISSPNQLSAYYKGKKIAVVDHNNYDEEFELNLLLRRACLKLKGEHTVVKTVEDLL